jgi:hypothetical protein
VIERIAQALDIDRFWAFDIRNRVLNATGEICNPGRSSVKNKIGGIEQRLAAVRLCLGDSSSDGPLWDAADVAVVVGSYTPESGRFVRVDGTTSSADEILALLD